MRSAQTACQTEMFCARRGSFEFSVAFVTVVDRVQPLGDPGSTGKVGGLGVEKIMKNRNFSIFPKSHILVRNGQKTL